MEEEVGKQPETEQSFEEKDLINENGSNNVRSGVFETVDEAIARAKKAQKEFAKMCLADRKKVIDAVREAMLLQVDVMAQRAFLETGLGNADDKVNKHKLAILKTPGVEDLVAGVQTGDHGMTLYELSPYGVIGALTPSTNPTETIISNAIAMLAAGNAIYFGTHPSAKNCCLIVIEQLNNIIKEVIGIEDLIVTIKQPTVKAAEEMMAHPDIALLVITGGSAVVKKAMSSGKKVIAAGAGNPPVIVDETANIEKAASDIVSGASFDNNILCIAEKSIIAVDSIADSLMVQMEKNDAFFLKNEEDINKMIDTVTVDRKSMNGAFIGKSTTEILKAANIDCDFSPRLIVFEATKDHPLAKLEQLMPVIPFIRVSDFDEAFDIALELEKGYGHTAVLHSQNISRLNRADRDFQTAIFVKNGPSYAGLSFLGEGAASFTIATPTGEGVTTARHFAKARRCVLIDAFSVS